MLKERLQILVDSEQRRRLDAEARRRRVSVGALVREAIDARLGSTTREERLEAVEEMARVASGKPLPVAELDRIVDAERARRLDHARPGPPKRAR